MISTRSTSSAGMRSTIDGVVVRAAGDAPAVDQDLRVLAADAAQRRLGVLADVALEADAGHALHHVADGERLEALEVFLVVRQHRRRRVHPVARVDALRQHLDLGQFGLRHGRRLGEHRRGQGRKAHGHRDSRKCRKLFHRIRPPRVRACMTGRRRTGVHSADRYVTIRRQYRTKFLFPSIHENFVLYCLVFRGRGISVRNFETIGAPIHDRGPDPAGRNRHDGPQQRRGAARAHRAALRNPLPAPQAGRGLRARAPERPRPRDARRDRQALQGAALHHRPLRQDLRLRRRERHAEAVPRRAAVARAEPELCRPHPPVQRARRRRRHPLGLRPHARVRAGQHRGAAAPRRDHAPGGPRARRRPDRGSAGRLPRGPAPLLPGRRLPRLCAPPHRQAHLPRRRARRA